MKKTLPEVGTNLTSQLTLADTIVDQLGNDDAVIAAAQALVGAEKNFNPSAQDVPTFCSDASLPVTEALRGILPLVDPAVNNSAVANDNAAASLAKPLNADGLSIADLSSANGFDDFQTQDSA